MTPARFRRSLAALTLTAAALTTPACQQPTLPHKQALGPPVAAVRTEPIVRIRVGAALSRAELDGVAGLRIGPLDRPNEAREFGPAVSVTRRGGAFVIAPRSGQAMSWQLPILEVTPSVGDSVRLNGVTYPHRVVLRPGDAGQDVANRFDAVNHTTLDEYLPGVLDRELYPRWDDKAYQAQAVAARSYALFSCGRNQGRHYDLEATVASQVYGGSVSNAKALDAVRQTRGIVLTYGGRVVPAYYSAASGGTGQDAVVAFGDGADIPPLRGRQQGAWEVNAKYYRWGPITRNRQDLARRIAAWGVANNHSVSALRDLKAIDVTARSSAGRPAWFRLTDTSGRTFPLRAEQFRFACNQEGSTLAPLPEAAKLRSSHVSVRVSGGAVQFWDGRGHGHGVGMSQWGAQAMAEKGYGYSSILAFYYPGAKLERLY